MIMKKLIYSAGLVMAVSFAASCAEKFEEQESVTPVPEVRLVNMTFSASDDADGSKTVLVDGAKIWFLQSDELSVFDGEGNRKFTTEPQASWPASHAAFSGQVAESAETFYALYPYTAGATLSEGRISGVAVPSEQTATEGTFAPGAAPSVCKSDGTRLLLLNVASYVKFTVPSGQSYSKVVVVNNDGAAIAGTLTVNAETAEVVSVVSGSSQITLSGEITSGKTYYISLLPGTLGGGLTMEFYSGDGKYIGRKSTAKSVTFTRAKVKPLGEVAPVITEYDAVPGEFTINAQGDKVQFADGNLQYQASSGIWKFADTQYTVLGQGGGNQTEGADRATQSAWIDLFGWGCTGLRHEGMTYSSYQPWATSTNSQDYYKQEASELSAGNYTDWGCLLSNGEDEWFTLSRDEITYIATGRGSWTDVSGKVPADKRPAFANVKVNGVYGTMLFADDWKGSMWPAGVPEPKQWNRSSYSGSYGTRIYGDYTAEEFALIEATGVVFLPAVAGFRTGCVVGLKRGGDLKEVSLYSTRTPKDATSRAIYCFAVGEDRDWAGSFGTTSIGTNIPSNSENVAAEGYSVRLVRRVKVQQAE